MAIKQGANPEQLRALGKQFTMKSTSVKNVQGSIDQLTSHLPQVWGGKDAEEFARQWAQLHRPAFAKLAAALSENARTLAANAEAQETTSAELGIGTTSAPGPGAPGSPSGAGVPGAPGDDDDTPWIPDWLENSPFFGGWDMYNAIKAFPNIRFALSDLYLTAKGLDAVTDADRLAVQFRNAFKVSSDLFDGAWGDIAKMSGVAESSRWVTAFDVAGKSLGWLDVGINVFQGIDHLSDGDYGDAAYSGVKAALGAGSILAPPPANVACLAASGALALYDNVPIIHDTVNAIGSGIADAAEGAWDGAKDFFGF